MSCLYFDSGDVRGFVCGFHRSYKLRLLDGRRVFMKWHHYFGPIFYLDRFLIREIDDWHKDKFLCRAVEWFLCRGKKA